MPTPPLLVQTLSEYKYLDIPYLQNYQYRLYKQTIYNSAAS